jgi:hypothetical protein
MATKEISVNVSKKIGQPQFSSIMLSASITMTVEDENVAEAYDMAWKTCYAEIAKQEDQLKMAEVAKEVDEDPDWLYKEPRVQEKIVIDGKVCPKCGKKVWDNRAKIADGTFNKKSPHFSCSDKVGCKWAVWGGKYELKEEANPFQ